MTEKKRYFTRNIALLLCLALILSLCPRTGASAESGNKIVLTTAEGTVIVKSASGKLQDAGEGAELSGGSTVITGPKSFVWLALDDTKAVKLDSNSEVEFRKRDKIYDIFIRSGRIFFTVPEKLADDETMRIYASSNAVTEIRGTDGWADTDSTGLLTGKIKLTITDPVTGKVVVKWVEAGQSLSGLEGARKTPEKVDLSYLKATLIRGDQMPAIVPEVLIEQPQICERAKQNLDRFGFDIDEMIASAAEKRAKEDAEAAKKAEQITDEIAKNQPETQEEKIPVFKEETVEDPGPDETTVIEPSGGGGYVPDPIPDTPTTCSLTLLVSDYYYIESDDLTLSAEGDNTFYTAACGTTVTGRIGFITDI